MGMMGHGPTVGPANRLYLLGQRKCPDCRPDCQSIAGTPDLQPSGNSSLSCPSCGSIFQIGGVP